MPDDGHDELLAAILRRRRLEQPLSRSDVVAERFLLPVIGWGGALLLICELGRQLLSLI